MRRAPARTSRNLGTAKSPVDLGDGVYVYKREGRWRYRTPETVRRHGNKFVETTDSELLAELASRGYCFLSVPHECMDRPHLPCPACERAKHRNLGLSLDNIRLC
jgi:hypothetical protein